MTVASGSDLSYYYYHTSGYMWKRGVRLSRACFALLQCQVPSQNSSRFPFQRVEWQQVRSLVISSTSLVWIKMHAVATGRTFALEAPVDFRLARLQRICISPATRKKDTTQAQRAMQVHHPHHKCFSSSRHAGARTLCTHACC